MRHQFAEENAGALVLGFGYVLKCQSALTFRHDVCNIPPVDRQERYRCIAAPDIFRQQRATLPRKVYPRRAVEQTWKPSPDQFADRPHFRRTRLQRFIA